MRKKTLKWQFVILIALSATSLLCIACGTSPSPTPSINTPSNNEPIEVVSVTGPIPPINPGGPNVEITLKNVSNFRVVLLTAVLQLTRSFNYNFDISLTKPLPPGESVSTKMTLIGGGFDSASLYSLRIRGSLSDSTIFDYTKQVQIKAP